MRSARLHTARVSSQGVLRGCLELLSSCWLCLQPVFEASMFATCSRGCSDYLPCWMLPHAGPGHEPVVFVGRTDGRIVPARGPPDFGWVCGLVWLLLQGADWGATWPPALLLQGDTCRPARLRACAGCRTAWQRVPMLPRSRSWDPIFEAEGFGQTYAEMDKEVRGQR